MGILRASEALFKNKRGNRFHQEQSPTDARGRRLVVVWLRGVLDPKHNILCLLPFPYLLLSAFFFMGKPNDPQREV